MKIVFSRKGFDSASGGGPSPIVDGRPVSLPIPACGPSQTAYGDLGLGEAAALASRGRYDGAALCHHDPMFTADGQCIFGQIGAAQTHLERQGVGPGDLFLFFGLFAKAGAEPNERAHHRIFGWLRVERVIPLAEAGDAVRAPFAALAHPHALGMHASNDTLWVGPGAAAARADEKLRLSVPGGLASMWQVPDFLGECGLTYHGRADRWDEAAGTLRTVGRGQEFVSDIGDRPDALAWAEAIVARMPAQAGLRQNTHHAATPAIAAPSRLAASSAA